MPNLRPLLSCLLALAIPGCFAADDEPTTSEAIGAIGTAGHWSAEQSTYNITWQPAQIGTVGTRTISITAGDCGDSAFCFPEDNGRTQISQATYVGPSNYMSNQLDIDGQTTHDKVSLAAFNGYLYMAHMGGSDNNQNTTWLTRFDPNAGSWTPDRQIAYPTNYGPPAMVAFNNKLYFIGTSLASPYQMWFGTMDTAENFSAMTAIPGHQTNGRINATVAFGQVFYSHRWGSTTDIVYGTFNGSAWSPVNHIYGGTNNSPLQGYEAAIASDGNRLHLIHTRPGSTFVWWSQFDNCNWSSLESQIGSIQSDLSPALAAGIPGMVMLVDHHNGNSYDVAYATWTPPSMPSRCLVNSP